MTPKTILELQELAFQGRVLFNNGFGMYVCPRGELLAYLNNLPPNDPIFAWYRDWEYKILPETNDAEYDDPNNKREEPEFGGGERSGEEYVSNWVELDHSERQLIRAALDATYGPYNRIGDVRNIHKKLER